MKLKSGLFCFSMMFSLAVLAQDYFQMDSCYEAILQAEQERNFQIYSQCGFDDERYGVQRWRAWIKENKAYQAMYELCIRHPNSREAILLCQEAAQAGNGSALLDLANDLYDKKNYIQALKNYAQALKSPLLTEEEKGQISEKIGVLYLDKKSTYYNPTKAFPLIEKATTQRSALANNIMGVYLMMGLEGQPVNMEKSFEYLWRSVLLGCPNAEENLGLFYLLYQQKISRDDVKKVMTNKILSCQSDSLDNAGKLSESNVQNCDCKKVIQMEKLVSRYPYRLVSVDGESAVIMDENKDRFTVTLESSLSDGSLVKEIRKSAVILLKNNTRQVLNLAPDEICLNYCVGGKNKSSSSNAPNIEPYHLSFTPSECSSILYYAERLVDTNLPFVGKQECGFSNDLDEATQMLLQ